MSRYYCSGTLVRGEGPGTLVQSNRGLRYVRGRRYLGDAYESLSTLVVREISPFGKIGHTGKSDDESPGTLVWVYKKETGR